MDILTLIKERKTIRKYTKKKIPKNILNNIIKAGIWGPAVPSFLAIQPWYFVVIVNKDKISRITKLLSNKAQKSSIGIRVLLGSASRIVSGCAVLIVIFNSDELAKIKHKFRHVYSDYAGIIKAAQHSAISAAIQNMILTAEALGVGSCWLDTPIFCEKDIKKYLNCNYDLVAFLTLGYPDEKGRRSQRQQFTDSVRFVS